MLNSYTKGWGHDWTNNDKKPYHYKVEEFDEIFQQTGIAVVLFVQGEELAAMQKECSGRAKEWAKFTIQNDVEVIDPKTKIWRVMAKDDANTHGERREATRRGQNYK